VDKRGGGLAARGYPEPWRGGVDGGAKTNKFHFFRTDKNPEPGGSEMALN